MNAKIAFYTAFFCCVLGWVFVGLGIVFFPLSLFLLTRSHCNQQLFVIFVMLDIMGLTLSLYANAQMITKQMF
ncbi:MAG: hypothetical protein J1E28_05770 [Helicobacter sp.]|uniref:hypothetical protein n=1 Tax=Helicobacter sp. TaxID=218 RepID=UPI0025BFDC3A|nr:hypothetical protein [Helicobacter sp.]MCH5313880.1 hypothetical protein [Helicobacter sp.]